MPWDRKAKIDYITKRRRHAIEYVKNAAKVLDLTPKQTKAAIKKIRKKFSKEYITRRDNLKKANSLNKKVIRLQNKKKQTKQDIKEIKKLQRQHGKLLVKTHAKWNKFMESVGYITAGEEDERNAKAGSG